MAITKGVFPDSSPEPDMEIKEPTSGAPSPISLASNSDKAAMPLGKILSIDELTKILEEEGAMDSLASLSLDSASATSKYGKKKCVSSSRIGKVAPVPLPKGKPVAVNVARLNGLCQLRGLHPVYEIEEMMPEQFVAVLRVGERVFMSEKPVGSKKEAKERVAEMAVKLIEAGGEGLVGEKKRVVVHRELGVAEIIQEKVEEERWADSLFAFINQRTKQKPIYTEFRCGFQHFSCELAFTLDGVACAFGDRNTPLISKKAAKNQAAKEAVLWLREKGLMPAPLMGNPNGGVKHGSLEAAASTGAAMNLETGVKAKALPTGDENNTSQGPNNADPPTFSSRLASLCTRLGLASPQYRLEPCPSFPGMIELCTAWFMQTPLLIKGSRVEGPFGEVRMVFGKKAAKEKCAEAVLEVLVGLVGEMVEGNREVKGQEDIEMGG
ncbi:hypothetical protein K402DRAFT_104549 [Aulographum hederae CBS 113979]|uniref:DRBM domain-containing protein n=1 Tax=Aulographum hederae CBS 113979 TaxID=1176131 RepID=A0A6G1GXA2_9PEZI|nr:hypothetical protein K402DRAFT_104549 [Aulographum hederae CBS 113979]